MQRTPAGFPAGIPGMGEEIDRAIQQAPQPARQSISEAAPFKGRRDGGTTRDYICPLAGG